HAASHLSRDDERHPQGHEQGGGGRFGERRGAVLPTAEHAQQRQPGRAALAGIDPGSGRRFAMSRAIAIVAGLFGVIVIIALFSSFYFVNQTEEALVLQFGAPQAVITEPGLHFKTPLTQSVVFFDKRVLLLDALPEEVIASDKKRMVVDAFARWRITDPLRFYPSLPDKDTALTRLSPILS